VIPKSAIFAGFIISPKNEVELKHQTGIKQIGSI
jgi:hypothetical protein